MDDYVPVAPKDTIRHTDWYKVGGRYYPVHEGWLGRYPTDKELTKYQFFRTRVSDGYRRYNG